MSNFFKNAPPAARPPPAPPQPPPPDATDEDAYKAFCSEVRTMEEEDGTGADGDENMTWAGIEDMLRTMMAEDEPDVQHGSKPSSAPAAKAARAKPNLSAGSLSSADDWSQVKEEIQEEPLRPSRPQVFRPGSHPSTPSKPSVTPRSASKDDYWLDVPDFVDIAESRTVTPKKELLAPSRMVPSGHKLVKLRPAPYEVSPVLSSPGEGNSQPSSSVIVKSEIDPVQQQIFERRDSRRMRAFVRDARCKAICKIKYGLRQLPVASDIPFELESWSTEFEPLLGNYHDFLRSRPDQFLLLPVPGSEHVHTVVNVAGAATVKAPAWRKDWKVKSEKAASAEPGTSGIWRDPELDKTEEQKWNEAEPIPSRKRPYNGSTNGKPWSSLPRGEPIKPWSNSAKIEATSPAKPQGASKSDGDEWTKANSWKRYRPLNMGVLAQPLAPMRPVRDLSSTNKNEENEKPVEEEKEAPAEEEEDPDAGGSGDEDEDCFVVDVIGGGPTIESLMPVKEEPEY